MTNTTKNKFYKNHNEILLKCVVDNFYNDYVGGNENHYLDTGELYFKFDEQILVNWIVDAILKEKNYLMLEDRCEVLEAKHVRFMGKKRVREIVEHRVAYRHKKEGWYWEQN